MRAKIKGTLRYYSPKFHTLAAISDERLQITSVEFSEIKIEKDQSQVQLLLYYAFIVKI